MTQASEPAPSVAPGGDIADGKRELRRRVLAARRQAGPESAADAVGRATAIVSLLARRPALPAADTEVGAEARPETPTAQARTAGTTTVAAFVSWPGEPDTAPLLHLLREAGVRVLLPVLQDDLSLRWGVDDGGRAAGPRGTLSPTGPEARLSEAGVVCVPALAVDPRTGVRLGRGGGSYDRALAGIGAAADADRGPDRRGSARARVTVVALLRAGELLDGLPAEAHDRPVDAVALPDGVHRLPAR